MEDVNIVNVATGKVLDVPNANPANGVQIQQWDDIGDQQQKWQAIAIINRTMNGQATVCVDHTPFSPNFSGSSEVRLTLTIAQSSGDTIPCLTPLTIQAGGATVTITQTGSGSGHYHFGTGNLNVTLPLHIHAEKVPVLGTVNVDTSLRVSTRTSISTPCNIGDFQGSPAASAQDATGSITLVGTDTFQVLPFQNVTIQIRMAGPLIVT